MPRSGRPGDVLAGDRPRHRQPDLHLDPAGRLPAEQQSKARKAGLALALVSRLALLSPRLAWIVTLTRPFVHIGDFGLSWRDVSLIAGGLFLPLTRAPTRSTARSRGDPEDRGPGRTAATFGASSRRSPSSTWCSRSIGDYRRRHGRPPVGDGGRRGGGDHRHGPRLDPLARFISQNPTVKMLGLSFLLLIGVVLIAEGMHFHIPKGYVYFALGFLGDGGSAQQLGAAPAAPRPRRRCGEGAG